MGLSTCADRSGRLQSRKSPDLRGGPSLHACCEGRLPWEGS
jgi:hypothetical protein